MVYFFFVPYSLKSLPLGPLGYCTAAETMHSVAVDCFKVWGVKAKVMMITFLYFSKPSLNKIPL